MLLTLYNYDECKIRLIQLKEHLKMRALLTNLPSGRKTLFITVALYQLEFMPKKSHVDMSK